MTIDCTITSPKYSRPGGFILCASAVGWTDFKPSTGTIHGQVTYGGQPVTGGDITFYSGELEGGISESLDAEGKFVTQTPLRTGAYVVTILPPEDPSQLVVRVVAKAIPAKYRDPNKSGLTIDVREGVNSFDLEMKP
ncbi:hypothetical protein LOC68_21440 [Blastopirellula sp. JC732]|uniref:Carboxypeptidase regulatory-like domain-containing protein n=1 Tax=Blastopirellula sediminis TaxID=2894196 RepID=A0A9X1MR78_9BACT|nr:hypothetical protein [Blastopirellula sediminis]MCC9605738.1 hypothetical protein [Blastopirellula sediminis]MCC9630962.1 hypothetical protein [Blastopirellula sediminis]